MKKHLLVSLLLLTTILAAESVINAQSSPNQEPATKDSEFGKPISLPQPDYPPEAKAARAEGSVKVRVMIDKAGNVTSAKAIEGSTDNSLRQAAEAAAMKTVFQPTIRNGAPVMISRVLTYNFVAESGYEKRLGVMGIAVMLKIVGHFAEDLKVIHEFVPDADELQELEELPAFSKELEFLSSLGGMTPAERTAAVGKASAEIRSQLNESEKWQFEVGGSFAGIVATLRTSMPDASSPPDLDTAALKKDLRNIAQLTRTAPSDFPPELLEYFTELGTMAELEDLDSGEKMSLLSSKLLQLIETISPGDR